jgi:hypothetical protein
MFDLRYHVASLAAVFLALVLGIAIGAAISDPTLADATENQRLERTVDGLRANLAEANLRASQAEAARGFAAASYDAVVHERLADTTVLVLSIGPVDERVDEAAAAVRDAGGTVARMRALDVPDDTDGLFRALLAQPALEGYATSERLVDLGRAFAHELVDGGETPLVDALSPVLVQETSRGLLGDPVDAVVVARSAEPHRGTLARFLTGLYEGLDDSGPAVAVEVSDSPESALAAFRRAELSTVDAVDTAVGKVALVVLLAGGPVGDYGIGTETVVPPIEPLDPPPADAG